MARFIIGLWAGILFMALSASPSPAGPSMKCGLRYVGAGDTTDTVRSECGEPTEITTYERDHPIIRFDPDLGRSREVYGVMDNMETWFYDFGPTRFTRTLTFENGKLINIETGGYGQ